MVSGLISGIERCATTAPRIAFVVAAAFLFISLGNQNARAQLGPTTTLTTLPPDTGNAANGATGALFDLTTKFLRNNANQADTNRFAPGGFNPGGGGASEQPDPRWRFWSEAYGLWSRTGAQNVFTGDRRRSYGAVAGLGYALAPGASVGVSVDQGHTKINVPAVAQSATVDLTQIGANASIDSGPWTFSLAFIHGFGDIHSSRSDGGGAIGANYDTHLWGAITEISYYWSSGSWRVVPKIGMDWTRGRNDSFVEAGGTLPVNATAQETVRTRVFAGAETGYSWFSGQTLYDVSAYGRAIEIVNQDVDSLLVTANNGTTAPRFIPGVTDARFEFNAGASASLRLSNLTRFYAVYDGRFRDGYHAHGATLGVEFRW